MKTWVGNLLNDLGKLGSSLSDWLRHSGDILLLWGFMLILLGTPAALIYMSATAPGTVEFCYLQDHWDASPIGTVQSTKVIGHREWRNDTLVAQVPNINMALELLQTEACHSHK